MQASEHEAVVLLHIHIAELPVGPWLGEIDKVAFTLLVSVTFTRSLCP